MIKKSDLISIRQGVDSDISFIFATWLRNLFHSSPMFKYMEKNVFMKHYHNVLTAMFTRDYVNVVVACMKDDPDTILGYAILSKDNKALHWIYIKKNWRKIGLAKDLVPETVTHVTHITDTGASIIEKYKLEYNPFLLGEEIK